MTQRVLRAELRKRLSALSSDLGARKRELALMFGVTPRTVSNWGSKKKRILRFRLAYRRNLEGVKKVVRTAKNSFKGVRLRKKRFQAWLREENQDLKAEQPINILKSGAHSKIEDILARSFRFDLPL